eukprot:9659380-Alexandrium_andersonii.AAC.1
MNNQKKKEQAQAASGGAKQPLASLPGLFELAATNGVHIHNLAEHLVGKALMKTHLPMTISQDPEIKR